MFDTSPNTHTHTRANKHKMTTPALSALLKDYQQEQQRLRDQNEQLRKRATETLNKTTKELTIDVNALVVQVFRQQQQLEQQAKHLHQQAQKFSKHTAQWLQLFTQLNQSIKELGDVENWAQHISADVSQVVKNVDTILSQKQQQQAAKK